MKNETRWFQGRQGEVPVDFYGLSVAELTSCRTCHIFACNVIRSVWKLRARRGRAADQLHSHLCWKVSASRLTMLPQFNMILICTYVYVQCTFYTPAVATRSPERMTTSRSEQKTVVSYPSRQTYITPTVLLSLLQLTALKFFYN